MLHRFLLLALVLICSPAYALDRYHFDPSHTSVVFYVNHLGFSNMIGIITRYDGFFLFDPAQPEQSQVEMTLWPETIRTISSALDEELQRDDFFDTAHFPTMHFKSRHIVVTGEQEGELTGDLTLRGVTHPVTFAVRFNKADYHPLTQDFVAGFTADGTLKRSEFGMDYLSAMVGDEVSIHIEAEGINMDRKKALNLRH